MSQKQQPHELVDGLIRAMDESLSEYNHFGSAEDVREKLARLAAYESLGTVEDLTAVVGHANALGVKVTELMSQLDAKSRRLKVAESICVGSESLEQAIESVQQIRREKLVDGLVAKHQMTREVVMQVVESVTADKVDTTLEAFKAQFERAEQLNESVRLKAVKYNLPHEQVKQVMLSTDEAQVESVLAQMSQAAKQQRTVDPVQESTPEATPQKPADMAHGSVVRLADRI